MSVEDLTIRQLPSRDIDRVEPLWNALREHHVSVAPQLGAPRAREDSWRRRRAQYVEWLADPGSFALIAEQASELVGYALVHLRGGSPTWPLSERAGELETLSTLPTARGRGIGTALLEAVRGELRALDVHELSLHVLPTNDASIRFYERHGFDTFALWMRSSL